MRRRTLLFVAAVLAALRVLTGAAQTLAWLGAPRTIAPGVEFYTSTDATLTDPPAPSAAYFLKLDPQKVTLSAARAHDEVMGMETVESIARRHDALAAVNAVGDIRDPATGTIIAGARVAPNSMEFADGARLMKGGTPSGFTRGNTTLVCVATNAKLDKIQATKVAQLAHLGMARAIHPVNTMSDGDLVVALSLGSASAPVDSIGVAAAEAVAEAILRAVKLAPSLGGLPGLH